MDKKKILLIGGALLLLLMGYLLLGGSDEPQEQAAPQAPPEPEIETAGVLRAIHELKPGDIVSGDALNWERVPVNEIAENAILRDAFPNALEIYQNAVIIKKISPATDIEPDMLLVVDRASAMAALLRKGMRAFSIPLSPETGAGGSILAGDFVDVIVSHDVDVPVGNHTDRAVATTIRIQRSETLLRQVRVLAIDQTISDGEPTAAIRTATLEVMPSQTEILSLATRKGTVALALRSIAERVDAHGNPIDNPLPETVIDLREDGDKMVADAENRGEKARERTVTLLRAGDAISVSVKK